MCSGTHLILGALTGGLTVVYAATQHSFSLPLSGYIIYPVAVTLAAAIGGIAPDIDMAGSVSGKFIRTILRIFLIVSAVLLTVIFFNPSIDLPLISNVLKMGTGVDRTYPMITAIVCIILYFAIEKAKHRGFTHTLVIPLIVLGSGIYAIISNSHFVGVNMVISLQFGFLIGWLSHLVADTFNYPGVPWLWPFTSNHLNIMRVDSGTSEETVFCLVAVLAYVVIYLFMAYPLLKNFI